MAIHLEGSREVMTWRHSCKGNFIFSRCRCPAHSQAFSGPHLLPKTRCLSASEAVQPPASKEYAFEVKACSKQVLAGIRMPNSDCRIVIIHGANFMYVCMYVFIAIS